MNCRDEAVVSLESVDLEVVVVVVVEGEGVVAGHALKLWPPASTPFW